MTPKEKAEELIRKYERLLVCPTTYGSPIECALIAVEMLIEYADDGKVTVGRKGLSDLEYWKLVKTEIEKL